MLIKYLPNNPTGYLQPDIRDLFLKLLTKADRKIFFSLSLPKMQLPNSDTKMRITPNISLGLAVPTK